jgi:hypothetical protein
MQIPQEPQKGYNIIKSLKKLAKELENQGKPGQIYSTFTTRRDLCTQVNINIVPIPFKTEVKYLGLHLDQKRDLEKPHKSQETPARTQTEKYVMVHE